jgi:hypothetical protein
MQRRGIPADFVESVLEAPQQVTAEESGLIAYQSQLDFGEGKLYLVRTIVNDDCDPPSVVTVYRTSKIGKYWRP